jgi:hypothetical protein
MILFLSDGRLGNQLFQYAFLNTVAKNNEKILTANMEQFIEKFDIDNTNFQHFVFGKYCKFLIHKLLKPFLMLCVKLKLIDYITQNNNATSALPTFTTQKGLLSIKLVETNFFQSEKFFDNTKVDFRVKEHYRSEAKEFFSQISKKYTKIFVHVRRGDYIFESYQGFQGIDLPKSYFENAMKEITKDIEDPFFIFLSDDFSYVECCFENVQNKIISKNSMATDLEIMSLCEYGIVSNSSFSWWGAYMMKNRKMVIFPKYWYGWKSKIESHIDIQPNWAKIIEVTK